MFFFLSQEWNIERRGQTRQSCVSTAAERPGDFTTTTCGEPQPTGLLAAGLANPNTRYIMNSISLGGSLLAAELPLPNLATPLAGGVNWSQSVTTPIDWNQFNVRLDYNISHTPTLMFRFTRDNRTNNAPKGNVALGLWGDDPYPVRESSWAQHSRQIVARLRVSIWELNQASLFIDRPLTEHCRHNNFRGFWAYHGLSGNNHVTSCLPTIHQECQRRNFLLSITQTRHSAQRSFPLNHSDLSAAMGSMDRALRAGTKHATPATTSRSNETLNTMSG